MKKSSLIIFILFSSIFLNAQNVLSGYIYDNTTKEVLINAIIYDSTASNGTVTNSQGYFAITTKSNELVVAYVGYQTQTIYINQFSDTIINIYLEKSHELLSKVQITSEAENLMNISRLEIDDLIAVPSIGGQVDVLKSTQILPGIQMQSEGSSRLIVRGGDPGQNMYMLDNTPLIYVNHLGGFMSVFNSDMINDITIYKGSFPAKYGGKLSSIVDITQREGHNTELKGSFGIGITDANLCLEGGLGKNLTFITTARKTLFDILLYTVSSLAESNEAKFYYGFHDINLKLSWKANKKNKFSFNVFQGDDYMNITSKRDVNSLVYDKYKYKNTWGNIMTNATWNCLANPKTFGRTVVHFTRYRIKDQQWYIPENDEGFNNQFSSSVYDFSINSVWERMISNYWSIEGGLHSSYIISTPYKYTVSGENQSVTTISENILNNALSLNNKLKISKLIELNLGIRYNNYYFSDIIKNNIEPRLDFILKTKKYGNLNINYMHVHQPSHLFISSGNTKTNEVWLPASEIIPISKSEQMSISWNTSFHKNMFNLSIGVYYKDMSNLITAKESFFSYKELEDWESIVEIGGTGTAKGLEVSVTKNYGKWTGMLSYHFSQSLRQFDNINSGEVYTYGYDRPHDISLFIKRELNKKWSFSVAWYFQSGLPYTPVLGRQMIYDPIWNKYYEAYIYGDRNSERIKNYHRLDIAFKYEKLSKRKKLRTVWTFSIYNVYCRQNPTYYYLNKANNTTGEIYAPGFYEEWFEQDMYQFSLFSFIPSVSYKVYFNKSDLTTFKEWFNYEN